MHTTERTPTRRVEPKAADATPVSRPATTMQMVPVAGLSAVRQPDLEDKDAVPRTRPAALQMLHERAEPEVRATPDTGSPSGWGTIRRFGVGLHFEDDPQIPNVRVTALTFTGRPGDTFVGGDPQGTRRHLVSWALEQQAYQAAVQHKTMAQLAIEYGGQGYPATKQHVETAIKNRIAGNRGNRLVHQGSAEGNQALGLMEQQGKAQLRQPNLSQQDRFRAHVMAFMGSIDMPAFSSGDAQHDFALLDRTVQRAAHFYTTANGLTDQDRQMLIEAGTAALWNTKTGSYRSGDEISQQFRPNVMSAQYGVGASSSSMFGHFTVNQPQHGQQTLGGPSTMGTLNWKY